jgi:excisionase family DNA binding protein
VTAAEKHRVVEQRYTPADAAALMSVNKETILRAIRAGDLPAKRNGKSYRLKGSDLDHWYENLEDA